MEVLSNILFCVVWGMISVNMVQAQGCPDGWRQFQNKCYHFSRETESWADAYVRCTMYGTDLVAVETAEEDAFLKSVAEVEGNFEDVGYWIDGCDSENEGDWLSVQTGRRPGIQGAYSNWASGEPSALDGENCMRLSRTHNWQWADLTCNNYLHYICEGSV